MNPRIVASLVTALLTLGASDLLADSGSSPAPSLALEQTDAWISDPDGSHDVSVGDVLRYTAVVRNEGSRSARQISFLAAPAPYTVILAGTVTTSQGTVRRGNGPGETTVEVNLNELRRRASVTITWQAEVTAGPAPGLDRLVAQSLVSAQDLPGLASDDPDTPLLLDPTVTPLGSGPSLAARQTVEVVGGGGDDDDDEGEESRGFRAGDRLLYRAVIVNRGNITATGVVFTETPPAHTALKIGSVFSSRGTVTGGNTSGDTEVRVDLGALAPGAGVEVRFTVRVGSALPPQVLSLSAQGRAVTAASPTGTATDDPGSAALDDPTVLWRRDQPFLEATKADLFFVDADGDSRPGAGDSLLYLIRVANRGHAQARTVTLIDAPGANSHLTLGSVVTSQGTIVSGNTAGDTAVGVALGRLNKGESATVVFTVEIADPLPAGADDIRNQGEVRSANLPALPTDDPATSALRDPTVTPVATLGSIGGFAWQDLDRDGIQDAGEPGLAGVVVRLLDQGGAPLDTATTGADGLYQFADLGPGRYAVGFTARAGYAGSPADRGGDDTLDSDPDPTTGVTAAFDLLAGADERNLDAGFTVPDAAASLGGFVWHDLDGDGVQEPGEPGIAGVVVELLADGTTAVAARTTDIAGSYRFDDLDAGTYSVATTAPTGYFFTILDQGGDDAVDSDTDPATGTSALVTLAAGDTADFDAGFFRGAAIAGRVWADLDGDGIRDFAEPGLADLGVELRSESGTPLRVERTDFEGRYGFNGLVPATYRVRVSPLVGFVFAPKDQGGDDGQDSDVDPITGESGPLALPSGGSRPDLDAGIFEPVTTLTSSPAHGEVGVASTRETILRFSSALAPTAVVDSSVLFAEFAGRRLGARIHVAPDRRTATLFYNEPLPPAARVRVTLAGDAVLNVFGNAVDGDHNGLPGGVAEIDFDTLGLTTIPGTGVCGRVFASELAPSDSGMSVNRPLSGVTISVDGREGDLFVTTDALGNFCLDPAPVGRFFVHVDGRTATVGIPPGTYYPFVGKTWESVAGRQVNVGDVFLPLVPAGTLQPVSPTADTPITFAPSVLAQFPELAGVEIMVPADSLYANDGTRGGMVGIAPVPPDRLPGTLPEGLMFPVVITVQTDGATNFDRPLPACFPNLPDPSTGAPLPPGTKNALFSFNHDTGEWYHVGPMTVTADGRLICTDPGVGIEAPGWHGSGPPPEEPPPPAPEPPDPPCPPSGPTPDEQRQRCQEKYQRDVNWCDFWAGASNKADNANQLRELAHCAHAGTPLAIGVCVAKVVAMSTVLHKLIEDWHETCLFWAGYDLRQCLQSVTTPPPNCPNGQLAGLFATSARQGPRPPGTGGLALQVEDPVSPILQQIESLVAPYLTQGGQVPQSVIDQIPPLLDQANSAGGGSAEGFLRGLQRNFEAELPPIDSRERVSRGEGPPYPVLYAVEIDRPGNPPGDNLILRGTTKPRGQFSLFIPRSGSLSRLNFYDPRSRKYSAQFPRALANQRYRIPRFGLVAIEPDTPDSDGDGLIDAVEFVYGTDPFATDSDHDGVLDGPEVDQGTNPLDGQPTRTGVIASADTPGTAVDVCAVNNVAVVADSAAGVTVFNVFNGMNPVAVAQVDTPGDAKGVACAGNLIAAADGASGLAVIDVGDPPAARILHQVNLDGSAQAVTVGGNIAYVGTSTGRLFAVDLPTGSILDQVQLGGSVQDVTLTGDTLYALTVGTVHAIPLGTALAVSGTASSPGSVGAGLRRLRLFAGGGVLYATHTSGYNTFSLADPDHPSLIALGNTPQRGWKQVVANGSGLGFAAVSPNSTNDGPHEVSLYDVRDPSQTNAFLTQFETPGLAAAVAIVNGLGYVADSLSGLQVVNYLPYDAQGVPPTIALSTNFATGVAEEGQQIRLTAEVGDDVQVRNVEFFADGVHLVTDGSFPFEHRFVTPLIAQQPAFTIRACANDTGGNRTCSAIQTVTLTTDATAPRVKATSPRGGAAVGQGTTSVVSATFSEPVDLATLGTATFRLFASGPDELVGTADDVAVPADLSFRADLDTAFLTTSAALPADLYRAVVAGTVSDLAGNAIGGDVVWTFRVRGPLQWINPAGGLWTNPANWSTGSVPAPGDLVRITLGGNYTVTFSGTATVGSLVIAGGPTLWVNGNNTGAHTTLSVDGDLTNHGTLRLESSGTNWSSALSVNGTLTNAGRIESNVGTGGARTLGAGVLLNTGQIAINTTTTLSKANGIYRNEGSVSIASGQRLIISGQNQLFDQNRGELTGGGNVELSNAAFNLNGGMTTGAPPVLINSTLTASPGAVDPFTAFVTGSGSRLRGISSPTHTLWVQGNGLGSHTTADVTGFTNRGTLRIESLVTNFESSVSGTFVNDLGGVINVNAGTSGTRRIAGSLNNRGTLNANVSLTGTGAWTNTGTVNVAAGQTLGMTGAAQSFNHDGGAISGAGTVQLATGATFNHNAGTVAGTPVFLVNATLNLAATDAASFTTTGSASTVVRGTLAPGQTLWVQGNGVGSHTTADVAGLINRGTLRIESIVTNFESSVLGAFLNDAGGVINVNAGTSGTRRIAGSLDNRGTLNANVSLTGTGAWTNTGTVNVAAGQTLGMTGAAQSFSHDGGAISGAGTVQLATGATFNHNAGTVVGTPVFLVNATLNLAATDAASFTTTGSASAVVRGTLAPGQTLWVQGNGVGSHTIADITGFTNRGTLRIESVVTNFESSVLGAFLNDAGGVINVNAGTSGTRRIAGSLENRGTLNANVSLTGTGAWTNTGTVNVAAGQTLGMTGAAQSFSHDGGTVPGAGTVQLATGARFNHNAGTVVGTPVFLVNATLNLAATAAASFTTTGSTSAVVRGTLAPDQTLWVQGNGVGSHTIADVTGLINRGTLRIESLVTNFESSVTGDFVNEAGGVINVNIGTNGTRRIVGSLDNRGLVTLDIATTVGRAGAAHTNTGSLRLRNGATLSVTGTSLSNGSGGTIGGQGTLVVSGLSFVNAGSIAPGLSPGTLSLTGALTQAVAGSLDLELGGTVAGSGFDQLVVSGAASLTGTLNVAPVNGFTPSLGQSFLVLRYGSRTGVFTTLNGVDLGGGLRLDPTYGATGLTLTVVAVP